MLPVSSHPARRLRAALALLALSRTTRRLVVETPARVVARRDAP
jgi:hypothetical protein